MSIIFTLTLRLRRSPFAHVLIICALAFAVYLNSLPGAFILDDKPLIVDNPLAKDFRKVSAIFSSPYWGQIISAGLYRPLTTFSYALNYFFGGLDPPGYHLANIGIHSANSALVYYLLSRIFGAPAQAFIAGIIFAAHPIHSEAVANVVGRAELLAFFFSLIAALLQIRALKASDSKSALYLGMASLSYMFALFSKESAIGFLPVLFFMHNFISAEAVGDWARKGPRLRLRKRLIYASPAYAAALTVYLALRLRALGQGLAPFSVAIPFLDNPLAHMEGALRFVNAAKVVSIYIKGLFYPVGLSADYSYNQIPVVSYYTDPVAISSLATIAALIALAVIIWPGGKALAFALFFFTLTFMPVSNMFFPIGTIMGERLLYIPSLSLALAFGWAFTCCMKKLGDAHRKGIIRAAPVLAVIALVAIFSLRTYQRNKDWRDEISLARSSLRMSPESAKANNGLGFALYNSKRLSDAVKYYGRAISIYPAYAEAHYNLAIAFKDSGPKDRSMAQYLAALHLRPDYPEALNNIGLFYLELKNEGMAEKTWLKATFSARQTKEPYNNLGKFYATKGMEDKAVSSFKRAIAIDNHFAEARFNLANLYARLRDAQRAAEAYDGVLRIKPDFVEALINYGAFHQSIGNASEAISLYLKAISVRGDYWKIYFNLGTAHLARGSPDKAIWGLKKALSLNRGFAPAYFHLGMALKEKGELALAESWLSAYRAVGKADPAGSP